MYKPKNSKFTSLRRSAGYSRGAKVQPCKWPLGTSQMALVSLGAGRVDGRQMEAGRVVLARGTRRQAKVTMPCFPDFPMTSKGTHSRMGKGKGTPDYHVFVACPGDVLYCVEGNPGTTRPRHLKKWAEALVMAGAKMPFATALVLAPRFPSDRRWREEYSSIGRALVSKAEGRRFNSCYS